MRNLFFSNIFSRLIQFANSEKLLSQRCNYLAGCIKQFHVSPAFQKERDRRYFLKGYKAPDEGTEGEHLVGIDANIIKKEDMFVDENTPNLLFSGVKFSEVPICNVRVSKNNTIINITDHAGTNIIIRSCGIEGFKGCRKGTNVAAQATALTLSKLAVKRGLKDVRLKIRGMGPGRMSSVKGLTMGGLNIISVTDETRVPIYDMARPRKVRRV